MFHRSASRLATVCINHGLLETYRFDWFCYKAEILLGNLTFFSTIIFLSIFSRRYIEIYSFVITIFFLRRRMGGCHASSAWICQIISILLVVLSIFVLGPLLEQISPRFLFILAVVFDLLSILLKPSYPPQLHFTDEEVQGNIHCKNRLLIIILGIQILSSTYADEKITVYTFLGVTTTFLSVLLEKVKYIERKNAA